MGVEGFAIGKAQQGGAVVDLAGSSAGWSAWCSAMVGEPGAEGLPVLGGVEAEEVGGSVGVGVGGVEDEGYGDAKESVAPV